MSADLLTSFRVIEEPGGLESALIGTGRLALLGDVGAAAELMGLTPAEFAGLSVRRFLERASDEDWATLVSRTNAGGDAFGLAVAAILERAVRDAREVFR